MNKARNIYKWLANVGWQGTLKYALCRVREAFGFAGSSTSTLTVRPHVASYPLVARLGGSSDMSVFRQIFAFEEYACLRQISSPHLIFDLGANVGYSSAFFLSCFPTARVVAVEADPDNYKLCCTNLAPFGDRVRVVLGAAWSERSRLVLSRGTWGDGREWASQVRAGGDREDASVEAWDIASLLEMVGEEHIDILKIDIERSELELFGNNSELWLPRVRNICIELHGKDCHEVFFNALSDFHYDLQLFDELTICLNIRERQ